MRLISAILTLAALALTAWAGQGLWLELSHAPATAAAPAQAAVAGAAPTHPAAPQSAPWPALFGERQPPKPQPPAAQPTKAEPQPPRPPKPPIESLGYRLKGVVQTTDATWAMVSHPTGEQLVRNGDPLGEHMTVSGIDAQGLWVSRDGDAPELLKFEE